MRSSYPALSELGTSSTRGAEGDITTPRSGFRMGGDPDNEFLMPFVRQFGPVDIDPGPYCCYVKPCNRLAGFRTQEALDRHINTFH